MFTWLSWKALLVAQFLRATRTHCGLAQLGGLNVEIMFCHADTITMKNVMQEGSNDALSIQS